jgi:hypothetical protein
MVDVRSRLPGAPGVLPLFRYAATAVAAGRVGLGVAALAWPSGPARPWVGSSAGGAAVAGAAGAIAAFKECTPGSPVNG